MSDQSDPQAFYVQTEQRGWRVAAYQVRNGDGELIRRFKVPQDQAGAWRKPYDRAWAAADRLNADRLAVKHRAQMVSEGTSPWAP